VSNPLVLVSANADWRAVKEILSPTGVQASPLGEFFATPSATFFHGGWGKISAAASTQFAIDRFAPHLLVNLGTCGGFAGRVTAGTVLLVEKAIVYDIIEQMGDPDGAIADYTTLLDLSWLPEPLPHPVQRSLLVSADRDIVAAEIPGLVEKYGAVAADWESGAIAWVARRNGLRCLILRGVTDLVGAEGGEAYGRIELFHARTLAVMRSLLGQLPDWLAAAAS
jgi:adenosylhomocysteine nucleosidase